MVEPKSLYGPRRGVSSGGLESRSEARHNGGNHQAMHPPREIGESPWEGDAMCRIHRSFIAVLALAWVRPQNPQASNSLGVLEEAGSRKRTMSAT